MASASSACKDLLERTPPGSPEDFLLSLRTCEGSCKDLLERNEAGPPQEPVHARIYNEYAAVPGLENPVAQTCGSLRKTCHKSPFLRECTQKLPGPKIASLRRRSKHGHVTRAIYERIHRTNDERQHWVPCFVRACAVETHMDMSQEKPTPEARARALI